MSHRKEDYCHQETIYCKLCSDPVRSMKEINGRPQMAELGNYKEITLLFDDNSAHETCICRKCSYTMDIEKASFLYRCDLKQWEREGMSSISKGYWKSLEARKVTSYKLTSRTVQ